MMGVGWNEAKSAYIWRLIIFITTQLLLGQRRVYKLPLYNRHNKMEAQFYKIGTEHRTIINQQ